jgi:hypothetical protein
MVEYFIVNECSIVLQTYGNYGRGENMKILLVGLVGFIFWYISGVK